MVAQLGKLILKIIDMYTWHGWFIRYIKFVSIGYKNKLILRHENCKRLLWFIVLLFPNWPWFLTYETHRVNLEEPHRRSRLATRMEGHRDDVCAGRTANRQSENTGVIKRWRPPSTDSESRFGARRTRGQTLPPLFTWLKFYNSIYTLKMKIQWWKSQRSIRNKWDRVLKT